MMGVPPPTPEIACSLEVWDGAGKRSNNFGCMTASDSVFEGWIFGLTLTSSAMGHWGTCLSRLQSCTKSDSDFEQLPLQTHLHSAIAAAVVQSRLYMNLIQCIISRHFMRDKKFHVHCVSKSVPPLQLAIIFTYTVRLRQFLA